MTEVLSDRALNRATLARQHLLGRGTATALELVERFAGVQAQEPVVPFVTLWSRIADFAVADLQELLERQAVLRVPLWRNTIHHVTPADYRRFFTLSRRGGNYRVGGTAAARAALDADAVARAARELLPATMPELARGLAERFPDHDPELLKHVARRQLPLVHLPPAGFWGRTLRVVNDVVEGCDPAPAEEALVLRYLAAFGPASVRDAQYFSGVTRLKPVFEALRDRLVTFRDARGVELFDLPDAPRPPEDTPAPVRFLGVFDNALIGYADRARILAPHHSPQIVGPEAPILVDGFAAATWTLRRGGPVVVEGEVPDEARAEAEALSAFLGADGVTLA